MAVSWGAGRRCPIQLAANPAAAPAQRYVKVPATPPCRGLRRSFVWEQARHTTGTAGTPSCGPRLTPRPSSCQVARRQRPPAAVAAEYEDTGASASSRSAGGAIGVAVADRPAVREAPSTASVAEVGTAVGTADVAAAAAAAARAAGVMKPVDFRHLAQETKHIVLVRHGLSSWNAEGRVQGSSDLSVLSEDGKVQAAKCREALLGIPFDACYASPITRAKTSAELIWDGREGPLVFLDQLREAHLLFLEGMYNTDAAKEFPDLFRTWREDPANFHVDGVYPVVNLWAQSRAAWEALAAAPGKNILVVTHKSILRALLCTALGLGPEKFRSVDISNGGICVFKLKAKSEPMLESLNLTSHLHTEGVYYNL